MSRVRKAAVLAALVALGVLATAVGAFARGDATAVTVTAGKPSELRFTLSSKSVPKGTVTFKVTNRGTLAHDFKVGGKKTKSLAKGKSQTLTVTFAKAGRYAYLCTLPGHAAGGMKGTITVK